MAQSTTNLAYSGVSAACGPVGGDCSGVFELIWRIKGLRVNMFRYSDALQTNKEVISFEMMTFVTPSIQLHPVKARTMKLTFDRRLRYVIAFDFVGLLLYFTMLTAGIAPAITAEGESQSRSGRPKFKAFVAREAPSLRDLQVALTKLPSNASALKLYEITRSTIKRVLDGGHLRAAYRGEGNRLLAALNLIGGDLFYQNKVLVDPHAPPGILATNEHGRVTVIGQNVERKQDIPDILGAVIVRYGTIDIRSVDDLRACMRKGLKLPKCHVMLLFVKRTTTFHLRFKCPVFSAAGDSITEWVRERREYWKAVSRALSHLRRDSANRGCSVPPSRAPELNRAKSKPQPPHLGIVACPGDVSSDTPSVQEPCASANRGYSVPPSRVPELNRVKSKSQPPHLGIVARLGRVSSGSPSVEGASKKTRGSKPVCHNLVITQNVVENGIVDADHDALLAQDASRESCAHPGTPGIMSGSSGILEGENESNPKLPADSARITGIANDNADNKRSAHSEDIYEIFRSYARDLDQYDGFNEIHEQLYNGKPHLRVFAHSRICKKSAGRYKVGYHVSVRRHRGKISVFTSDQLKHHLQKVIHSETLHFRINKPSARRHKEEVNLLINQIHGQTLVMSIHSAIKRFRSQRATPSSAGRQGSSETPSTASSAKNARSSQVAKVNKVSAVENNRNRGQKRLRTDSSVKPNIHKHRKRAGRVPLGVQNASSEGREVDALFSQVSSSEEINFLSGKQMHSLLGHTLLRKRQAPCSEGRFSLSAGSEPRQGAKGKESISDRISGNERRFSSDASNESTQAHQCTHCGKSFASGSALGGHRRWCHTAVLRAKDSEDFDESSDGSDYSDDFDENDWADDVRISSSSSSSDSSSPSSLSSPSSPASPSSLSSSSSPSSSSVIIPVSAFDLGRTCVSTYSLQVWDDDSTDMNKSVIDSFVDIPFSIHAGKFRRAYIYTGSRHHTLEYCNGGVGDTVERETCTLNIEYGLDPNTTKFNGWNGTLRDPDGETIVTRNAHSRVVDISTYELLLLQLPQPEPYTEHIHALVQRHPYRVSEHQGILVWFPLVILEKEQVREKSMDLDSSQGYWRKADLIQGAGGIGLVICYGVDLHSLKIMYEGIGAHYVLEMDEGGKRALFNGVNGVLRDAYGNAIPCKEISVNQLNVDIDLPPLPVFDDEDLDDNDVDSVDAYNLPDHLAYDFSSDGGGTGAAASPVIVGIVKAADAGQEVKIEQSLPTNSNGIVEHIIERPRYYCTLCSFGCLDLSCMQAHQFEMHSKVEMHRTNENNEGAAAQSRHVVFQCQRCHSFKTDLVDELEMHQSQCQSDAV